MKTQAKAFFRDDLGLTFKWWHRLAKVFFYLATLILIGLSSAFFYVLEESRAKQYVSLISLQEYFAQNVREFLSEQDIQELRKLRREMPSDKPIAARIDALLRAIEPRDKPVDRRQGQPPATLPPDFFERQDARSPVLQLYDFHDFGGVLLVFDSFVSDTNIGGSLGCVRDNGAIEWLSEGFAKENITCRISGERTLAQRIRAKYPGVYKDLSDLELESRILATYPQYSDLPRTMPSPPPGFVLEKQQEPPLVRVAESYECHSKKAVCGGDIAKIVKYDTVTSYTAGNYLSILLRTGAATLVWLAVGLILYYKGLIYVLYGARTPGNG